MAYIFLPPRTTNFFPGGPPYLAGLGLTVTSSINKQTDHDKWLVEKAAYDKALKAYQLKVLSLDTKYQTAVKAYNKQIASWNADYQDYLAALDTYNTQYAGIKRDNTAVSLAVAKSYGLSLSQAYYDGGACITQAEHDTHARGCSAGAVRGLGASGHNADCGYAKLPVCAYPSPPTIRPQPQAPAAPSYPVKPTLRAEPGVTVKPVVTGYAKVPPPAAVVPPSSGGGGAPAPQPDQPQAPAPAPRPRAQASRHDHERSAPRRHPRRRLPRVAHRQEAESAGSLMEQPHFSNPKGWLMTAAAAGLGYYWKGATGAAILGVPTLAVLGLASASAGDAMFQFLPPPAPPKAG